MKQPGQEMAVAADLYAVLEASRLVGCLLAPLVPDLAARMLRQLAQNPAPRWPDDLVWGRLEPGTALPEPQPVMARLELDAAL